MTTTTNKGLTDPAYGDLNWNVPLNANFDIIDKALGSAVDISVTGLTGTQTLTATQYQNLILNFTGTLTANLIYQVPSTVGGQWIISNNTTGAYTITFRTGAAGTSVVVPRFETGITVHSNGTDVYQGGNSNFVTVKDFGAIGDGTTDDTAAIQAALNAASNVYFPSGTYSVVSVNLNANQTIHGDGASSIILQDVGATPTSLTNGLLYADSGSLGAYLEGITIKDIQVKGRVDTLGFSQFLHLISLNGVLNATVENCLVTGFRGDGIYIGTSANGGQSRENKNVKISGCTIDGVNNDNRNGVSVIVGEDIAITNNTFLNCTRSNMPGAIDFEPNGSSSWIVIKNCVVTGNMFDNCGGNVATVGFYLAGSDGYTVKPSGITVANNTETNSVGGSGHGFFSLRMGSSGANTPVNAVITGNSSQCKRTIDVRNCASVVVSSNTFSCTLTGFVGYAAADIQKNILVTSNVFIGTNASYGLVVRGVSSDVVVSSNTFLNLLDAGLLVGIASGTVTRLSIMNNIFQNITGTAYSVLNGGGTIDGASCVYTGNTWSGTHNFPAWKSDSSGINSASAGMFTAATLPDSFPNGVSVVGINGDTGVPSTGGYQGTLSCFVQTTWSNKYIYQVYYPANNTVDLGSFYIRKRANASNAWTAWYKVTGV